MSLKLCRCDLEATDFDDFLQDKDIEPKRREGIRSLRYLEAIHDEQVAISGKPDLVTGADPAIDKCFVSPIVYINMVSGRLNMYLLTPPRYSYIGAPSAALPQSIHLLHRSQRVFHSP
jgi:hypothetical protein